MYLCKMCAPLPISYVIHEWDGDALRFDSIWFKREKNIVYCTHISLILTTMDACPTFSYLSFFFVVPPFHICRWSRIQSHFLEFYSLHNNKRNGHTWEKLFFFFLWIKDPISFIIMTAGTTSCCSLFVTSNGFELLINGERFVRIVDCHLIVLIHQYVSVEFLLLNSIFHCDLLFFHTLCIVGLTNRNCVSNRLKIS